jgi:ankyrin repeat protein
MFMPKKKYPNLFDMYDCVSDKYGANQGGRTPLHYAVEKSHMMVVRLLLHMGADPTAVDKVK